MKSVCDIWPYSEHEPLGFFIVLPLIRHEPWNLRGTQPMVYLEAALREVPEDDYVSNGHILREFLLFTQRLAPSGKHGALGATNPVPRIDIPFDYQRMRRDK
jgi:hypothetical protein